MTSASRCTALGLTLWVASSYAGTLTVGPGKTYPKPCAAIAAAPAGSVIEIEAGGTYDGDVCAWSTDNLTLRGVNGRPHLKAAGANAQGKGTYVVAADTVTFENLEFSGATVVDQNGAGIRHQGLNLTVRGCFFHDNENGILGSPKTGGQGAVLIENSEFASNGFGDGYSHNMYLGNYARFTLRGSWSHGTKEGHLVKSRAHENYVIGNRLTDEAGATTSYEIDLPNGGLSYVYGNLIEQAASGHNPTLVTYAEEGATNPDQHLSVVNNTFVNDRAAGGTFVNVAAAAQPARLENNLFIGAGTICTQASASKTANLTAATATGSLVDAAGYDYHLVAGAAAIDQGAELLGTVALLQYVHPTNSEARSVLGAGPDVGAYEFGAQVAVDAGVDAGVATPDAGAAGDQDAGQTIDADAGAGPGPATPAGCGCVSPGTDLAVGLALLLAGALRSRR